MIAEAVNYRSINWPAMPPSYCILHAGHYRHKLKVLLVHGAIYSC